MVIYHGGFHIKHRMFKERGVNDFAEKYFVTIRCREKKVELILVAKNLSGISGPLLHFVKSQPDKKFII